MAKKWKTYVAALGFGLFLWTADPAAAADTYYLNSDPTLPMIQNTGGVSNDGHTGLFMDLSTMAIDGVYKDGLSARVRVFALTQGNLVSDQILHVRYADTGKAWVLRSDGKWQETSESAEDPASMAVHFVKEEMGNEARRDEFMGQIEKLALAIEGEPPSIVPAGAVTLPKAVQSPGTVEKTQKAVSTKPKKTVIKQKKEKTVKKAAPPKEDVVVTITEAPKVEITPEAVVKVTVQ